MRPVPVDGGGPGRCDVGILDRVDAALPDPDWYLAHVVIPHALGETAASTRWRIAAEGLRVQGRVGELALGQGFVVTRAQIRACGVPDPVLRRRVRRGEWWVPRRGVVALVARGVGDAAVRASAAALVRGGHVISHRSAAAVHGLALVSLPGQSWWDVELTGPAPHLRAGGSLHIRTAALGEGDVVAWYGMPVTSPARTVVDLARSDRRQGLVAADSALRDGSLTRAELAGAIEPLTGRPGSVAARRAIAMASALSESPLESLTRLLLLDHDVPPPALQEWIIDPADGWRARVDMLWRSRGVVLEADGRLKYTDDELWREKRRQERLEQLGWRVVRVTWAEVVHHGAETVARVRAALRLS